LTKFREWWATPRSSLITHRTLKWLWVFPGIPISLVLRQSIPYLVFLSVYAIIVGHWGGEQAAEAEVKVDESTPSE
jgi:hypothetical protein